MHMSHFRAITDLKCLDSTDRHHGFGKGGIQLVKDRFSNAGGNTVYPAFDYTTTGILLLHTA